MSADCARSRFFVSTYSSACGELARRFGVGLEIIEFSIATHMDDHTAWDDRVRRAINGVDRLALHAPYHDLAPASIDPEVRSVTLKRFNRTHQVSAGYGVDRIVFHSGYTPKVYPAKQWTSRCVAFWREFLSDKPGGLKVLIENVAEEEPEPLRDLVDSLADQRVAVCLDVGHANANSSLPLPQWIATLGSRIGHVHLHNNDGIRDWHWRVDRGTIDMPQVLRLLAESAPHATFTIESAEEEESLKWLESNGFL